MQYCSSWLLNIDNMKRVVLNYIRVPVLNMRTMHAARCWCQQALRASFVMFL
jgi:hypothetical protein